MYDKQHVTLGWDDSIQKAGIHLTTVDNERINLQQIPSNNYRGPDD